MLDVSLPSCSPFAWPFASRLPDVSLPSCSPFAWPFASRLPDVCLAFRLAALLRPPLLPALRRASSCPGESVLGSLQMPSA
nr:MAG TPA: hypothetical protein [Caudoviricetes sp.]